MKNLLFTLKAWPIVTLVTIGLCFLTKSAASSFGVEIPDQSAILLVRNTLFKSFTSLGAFLGALGIVAYVVLVAPVLEEVFFRGLLFRLPTRLTERWIKARDARQETGATEATGGTGGRQTTSRLFECSFICLSSVVFSAAHYVQQPWPDAAFLALFFFGVAQCWLYRKTGRLWCAMLNHALFNLTNLVLVLVLPVAEHA